MDIDIYNVVAKDGMSFLHEEICRSCAEKFAEKGFTIEFDSHLYKYTYIKNNISYYYDGSDEDDPEIKCSLCGEYLVSNEKEVLKGSI